MFMKLRTASVYFLTICIFVLPAIAQSDLYDNGAINGTIDACTINSGFTVSDTFSLTSNSTVNGLNFGAWLFAPGDILESTEVTITSEEFGGTTYFDQQVNFTQSGCVLNQLGFNVCTETSSAFSGPSLNAGTYWLTLQNALVNTGDPVYWDENDGPSSASNVALGTIGSESFTILGSSSSGGGTTPEPSSILLFGSGVVGVGVLLRRKLS
jgi:hypothetical protein